LLNGNQRKKAKEGKRIIGGDAPASLNAKNVILTITANPGSITKENKNGF
jgi:hypothetical protein